jgi:2-polyprenyl-3-methyl-5-hydroxy-6-metoxy-1,4-benzoquinol methylase
MNSERGDMMGARLRQSHGVDPAAYERDLKRNGDFFRGNYLRHMPADKAAPILEIGCGLGQFLAFCRAHKYTDVTGIDLSSDNIAFCLERGLHVQLADGLEFLTATERFFGMIVMNDVIEHVPKPQIIPFLQRVHDRLLPGGALILKTINAANPILGAHGRYADFTHETGWTEESMRQVLEQVGFDPVDILPSNLYVFHGNPLNLAALGMAKLLEWLFLFYFRLHGRNTTHVFTKNLIAVARKSA